MDGQQARDEHSSLPCRQLRNDEIVAARHAAGSLPCRQLRNDDAVCEWAHDG